MSSYSFHGNGYTVKVGVRWKEIMSALVSARSNMEKHLERTESEQECDLMIEALRRELDGIRVRSETIASIVIISIG